MLSRPEIFTAVANIKNINVAHVSRAISLLKDELAVRLFHRTTQRITLTDVGERYYPRCQQILADLDYADAEAAKSLHKPVGCLRVHAMPGLGQTHLAACIVEYLIRYPNIKVDLVLWSTMPRLVEEQFDVSVVTAQTLPDSGYICQKFVTSYSVLVASPAYLECHPPLLSPEDPQAHMCVRLKFPASPSDAWRLESSEGDFQFVAATGRFKVNDPEALRVAIRAGLDIGALAVYSVLDDLVAGIFAPRVASGPVAHAQRILDLSNAQLCRREDTNLRRVFRRRVRPRISAQEASLNSRIVAKLSGCLEWLLPSRTVSKPQIMTSRCRSGSSG